jgi:hypothetical protein
MSRPDPEARALRAPTRRPAGLTVPIVVIGALVLAACSASGGSPSASGAPAAATATPTSAPTPAPATSSPAATETASANSAPTSYDPCALVTAAEASALTGTSFASGKASTTSDGGKMCAYTAGTTVFEVLVGTASSAAAAQAQEPAFKQDLENGVAQAGIVNPVLTELPGFESGVDAAIIEGSATLSGVKISAIAFYALKGATFFSMSEVIAGGAPATSAAFQAQAHTSLGRISG